MKIADLAIAKSARRITVPFKRYRGQTIQQVAAQVPDYLFWAKDHTDWGAEHAEEIDAAVREAYARRAEAVHIPSLTPHQMEQARGVLEAFDDGHPIARLQGGAGCGKSYAVGYIVQQMMRGYYQVNASAVSYVATQVINRQLKDLGVQAKTLARNLKFDKGFNEKTGADEYVHSAETPEAAEELLDDGRLLVIDECSMINDRDSKLLLDAAKSGYGKLLLVGDRFQLPPVKQDGFSRCCTADVPTFELAHPMRYNRDSALYAMEAQMRKDPGSWATVPYDEQQLCHEPPEGAVAAFVNAYRKDPDLSHRMLFYRRAQVTAANRILRATIFPDAAADVEPGEKLMVLATEDILPADLPDDEFHDRTKGSRYYSGEIFTAAEVREGIYEIDIDGEHFQIPHLQVTFPKQQPVRIIFAVNENSVDKTRFGGEEYQRALSAARALGLSDKLDKKGNHLWGPFRRLKRRFLMVAYTYATTVHRAQGQTMDDVCTDPNQLLGVGGRMGHALAYVACTRARRRLMTL